MLKAERFRGDHGLASIDQIDIRTLTVAFLQTRETMYLWPILSGVVLVAFIAGFLVHLGCAFLQNLNNHPGLD
jgi:hypothetical protein